MKLNIKKMAYGLLAIGSMLVASCAYDESENIMQGGQNLMRFLGVNDKFVLVAITPEPQELSLVTVKRDPISSAELDKTASISIVMDPLVLDAYNDEHDTDFTLMDPAAYTFVGSTTSVDFAAGEDAKDIAINIEPAELDLSLSYALAFVIKNPSSSYELSSGYDTAVVQVIIKNQYDGDYTSVGTRYNYNAAGDANVTNWPPSGFVSTGPWDYSSTAVSTLGTSTVAVHAANSNGGFGRINLTVTNTPFDSDNNGSMESFVVNIVPNADIGLNALVKSTHRQSYYTPATPGTSGKGDKFKLYYEYTNTNGTFRNLEHNLTRK
jgi:hypothetical protein